MHTEPKRWRTALLPVLTLLLLVAGQASALSWFGGDAKSRARSYLRRADETMTRADSVLEGGNRDQALVLYQRAATAFESLCRDYADLENGLPRYRLAYCRSQIARLGGEVPDDDAAAVESAATNEALSDEVPAGGELEGEVSAGEEPEGEDPAVGESAPPSPGIAGPAASGARASAGEPVAGGAHAAPTNELREAWQLLEADEFDAAARVLIALLREDPESRPARLMIAMVRSRQGRFDEALVALEELRATGEDEPLLLALAAAYYGAGRHFNALQALDRAMTLCPTQPHAFINMAWLRLAMLPTADGVAEAEVYYRRGVKLGARRDRQLERRLGIE